MFIYVLDNDGVVLHTLAPASGPVVQGGWSEYDAFLENEIGEQEIQLTSSLNDPVCALHYTASLGSL